MPTPLAELAVTFANHAYVSGVLAELETAWAADEADPAVRVHLARHGRHHSCARTKPRPADPAP